MSNTHLEDNKIAVIHNSIVTDKIETIDDIRQTYGINPSTLILTFTGRVVPEKGVDVLLDALILIKELDFKLLILGVGYKEYIDELNIKMIDGAIADKVLMVGFVDKVFSFISQSDIGIIPSVVREPFCLSIVEFMELGKVVVSTNNGAQPEFINDGINGFLVDPSDPQAIAERLKMLIEDHKLRNKIGIQAADDFAMKLSYNKFYDKIYTLYKEVM